MLYEHLLIHLLLPDSVLVYCHICPSHDVCYDKSQIFPFQKYPKQHLAYEQSLLRI